MIYILTYSDALMASLTQLFVIIAIYFIIPNDYVPSIILGILASLVFIIVDIRVIGSQGYEIFALGMAFLLCNIWSLYYSYETAKYRVHAHKLLKDEVHLKKKLQIELTKRKKLEKYLRERNRVLAEDLESARKIQESLLPINRPEKSIGHVYQPILNLGGDYLQYFPLSRDKTGIFISDVSGHGTAAAFITLMTHKILLHEKIPLDNPARVLTLMNSRLIKLFNDQFMTALYGVLNHKNQTFVFSRAGHPMPYIIREKQIQQTPTKTHNIPLGIFTNDIFKNTPVTISKPKTKFKPG